MADNELELGTVRPVNTPEIALGALLLAHDSVSDAPRDTAAAAAAHVSSAASLLMIAELLQELAKEIKQLRGILCTRGGVVLELRDKR